MSSEKRYITLHINSGICKCGCLYEDHHLSGIINSDAVKAIQKVYKNYPLYVPEECEFYGSNELGGKKYNKIKGEYEDHCHQYEDKDGPLDRIEW